MKIKTLLKEIEKCKQQYPDFEEWEVYTEQFDLAVPDDLEVLKKKFKFKKKIQKNMDYLLIKNGLII